MNKTVNNQIRTIITQYIKYISKIIQQHINKGELKSRTEPYQNMVIRGDLNYSKAGIGNHSMEIEIRTKQVWNHVEETTLSESFTKSDESKKFTQDIYELTKINLNEHNQIGNLNRKIVSRILSKKDLEKEIISPLYLDITDGIHESIAQVEIAGLTLEPKKIQLTPEIELRQPLKEDLEYEIHAVPPPIRHPIFERPDAILTITKSLKGNKVNILQKEIDTIISALQLTDLGSIKYKRYTLKSKTLLGCFGGTISTINTLSSNLKSHIEISEIKPFTEKFTIILNALKINKHKLKSTPLETAMEFFKESIVEQGKISKKIAESIMSLEALFSNSTHELKFRLSTRISKLIGLINKQPKETMNLLKIAYDIRSTYAHGSEIGKKLTKKINTLTGSTNELRKQIAEILRISILVMIQTTKTKNQLLELIDNALISNDKCLENELKNITV